MYNKRLRYAALIIVFLLMFVGIAVRLTDLQWNQGEDYLEASLSAKTRDIRITSTRGMILDRNGIILAYDQKSYDVEFVRDPSRKSTDQKAEDTEIIRKTISIIEKNGQQMASTFPIRVDEDGEYVYYFGNINNDEADNLVAINRWTSDMFIDDEKYTTAEEKYFFLRERYVIPETMTDEEAFKVLAVWQDVQMTYYRSYIPVVVAQDVNIATVGEIEMSKISLSGVSIQESTLRVYPKQDLASHLVGYLGKMQDEETMISLEAEGYDRDDLIGVYGIEATMESEMSGNIGSRTGSMRVEVNSLGRITRELSHQAPLPGNDVVLTIDSALQKKAEDSLAENIQIIRALQETKYQENKEYYDEKSYGRELSMAKEGAAVVLDVNTGEVLAMASYPSFDPNIFTDGLSYDEYEVIKNNTSNPLFNKAISSRATPGSIFKMVTGIAGLMEDGILDLTTMISDEGKYTRHIKEGTSTEDAPTCWIYPYVDAHKDQTIVEGLKNSCNYFFFYVGQELGIDKLYDWGTKLGLNSKTNIELTGEVTSKVGNQENLYSPDQKLEGIALLVYRNIITLSTDACESLGYEYEDALYQEIAVELMNMYSIAEYGPDARALLKTKLNLSDSELTTTNLYYDISHNINQLRWNATQTITAAIGQSVTLLTPVGVARYIAALVNGGNVYQVRLVDSIVQPDGTVIEDMRPQLVENLDIPTEFTDAIKEGMGEVVSRDAGGTAGTAFESFKYIDMVGGKTGTAQVTNIDIENNSWFVAFAPFEEPEIAVVIYIPNGYGGLQATYAAKEIIEFYLDRQNGIIEPTTIPFPNQLVP